MTGSCRRLAFFSILLVTVFSLTACGLLSPAKKPEVGPAGKPAESKPNPPVSERFFAPPGELYDIEAVAGSLFAAISKENWPQAAGSLRELQTAWPRAKEIVGEKKGVREADAALVKLSGSVGEEKAEAAYEDLGQFMGAVSDIAKSYKLSPLADIVSVGNAVRSVSFYAENNDWKKASSKAKALEDTWNHVKPSMEKVGILAVITTAHSQVKQLKNAVSAENKGAVSDQVANLNETLGQIRDFYRGQ